MDVDDDQVVEAAERLLNDLQCFKQEVMLIPAPDPRFSGHMVRVSCNKNPKWYRDLYWNEYSIKKCWLVRALKKFVVRSVGMVITRYEEIAFDLIKKELAGELPGME